MKIRNILVSQPTPAIIEKSPYYEIATKFGAKIDYRPFIKIEGVSLKEFRSQRVEILDHTAVIFTSRSAIDSFFRICEEARITVPETMKYLCNTEAVALYLQKYIIFRKRKIFFANGSMPNFMELILKHKNERMLLTLSEPYKPELPDALERLKLNFDKVVLARTVSSDVADIDLKKYDMLVFYSPSEIASLINAFGKDALPLIATFGNGTAKAVVEAGMQVNVMAPTPEVPSMTKAIELYIKRLNAGEEVPPVEFVENKQVADFLKAQEARPKSRARKPESKTSAAK